MFKKLILLFFAGTIVFSACGTFDVRIEWTPTPSVDAATVATIVAATLAAAPSATPAPGSFSVLPRSLYYWKLADPQTGIGQIDRLEANGIMNTQITDEPGGVYNQFDVSALNGELAYNTGKQLVLVDAHGWNRRVVAQNSASQIYVAWPRWSPDGRTIAYANKGIYFYSLEDDRSRLILANDGNTDYSPRDFSPDGSKLLLSVSDQRHTMLGLYDLKAKSLTLLQPSGPVDLSLCCSPVSWSGDSNHLYVSEKSAASGCPACDLPGLWYYNADGIGTALLPGVDASGGLIQNKTAAPWVDADGTLLFLFSPPGAGANAPFSLVRSGPDAVTDRIVVRSGNFYVVNALWSPKGDALVILQNDATGTNNKPANLVLVPADPALPVVTLLADASRLGENSLRWGP